MSEDVKYFDHAATTFMSPAALETYVSFQKNIGVLWGKGNNVLSEESRGLFERSVEAIRRHFGIDDTFGFIIGKNVTELINVLAHSLQSVISPMDIILVGPYEHHSNYLPWKYLARSSSAVFLEMPLTDSGEINFEFLATIAEDVKIVSCSTVSNVNGFEIDMEKVMELFGGRALIFTDESQKAAHDKIWTDERISGCILPSHKMYGPKNIAGAFLKADLLERMAPFFLGGGMIYHQDFADTWSSGQQKFYAGTYDVGLIAAWAEACRQLEEISLEKIRHKESAYFDAVRKVLLENPEITILNAANSAKSLLSFVNKSLHAHDVEELLSAKNFIIRAGNLCAQPALRKLNCNAVSRISFGLAADDKKVSELCDCLKNLTCTGSFEQYLENPPAEVIIPDDVLVKSGIACGDALTLQAELNDGVLKFTYQCDACRHSRAVLGYLFKNYNGRPVDFVLEQMQTALTELAADFGSFCKKVFGQAEMRRDCVADTFQTCYDFFKKLTANSYESQQIADTRSNLDCDACVSTGRVAWRKPAESLPASSALPEKVESTSDYPFEFRQKWMRLAKVTLSAEEIEDLRSEAANLREEHVLKFAKLKAEQMIFFNIKKYCPPNHKNPIWKNIPYRLYKKAVVRSEVIRLKKFVEENQIRAVFVKGAFTDALYENIGLRLFKDYDMIAMSAAEAFKIAAFLFKNGFKIFYSEFSLKKIETRENSVVWTGHFHLQKFVWDNYEIIIDVNFPGFPAGRISLYYPERYAGTRISFEDEFIVSLCHLFKHKDVFMKDLNDLFLILKQNLDYEYLTRQLSRYRLDFFAKAAVKYILQNYELPDEKKSRLEKIFNTSDFELRDWPYSYAQVYQLKSDELQQRSRHYVDHDRIYLFPLAIFNQQLNLNEAVISRISSRPCEVEKLDEQLFMLKYREAKLLLCGMGIFWDNSNEAEKCGRHSLEKELNLLIELAGMREHLVYLPYNLENRRVWFL